MNYKRFSFNLEKLVHYMLTFCFICYYQWFLVELFVCPIKNDLQTVAVGPQFVETKLYSGGGGILAYIGYTGMYRWKGYSFQAIYSRIRSSNHRKLAQNRVPFSGIAKQTKIIITKD